MRTFLNIVRWMLTFILSVILFLMIFIGLNTLVISSKISKPDNIKSWLSSAKIYENLVPVGLELIEQNLQEGAIEEGTSLDQQELENVARSVLEPVWVKEQVEMIIDSVYSWLAGDTQGIEFTIDLEDRKVEIVNAINLMLKRKFADAEVCTASDLAELQSQGDENADFNPFSYSCLPPGMTLAEAEAEVDRFTEEMFKHQEFLAEAKFDSSQLQLPAELERNGPMVYRAVKYGPLLVIFVAALISLLVTVTSPKHRFGFNLATVLWTVGGFLLIFISVIISSSYQQFIETYVANSIPSEQIVVVNEITKPLFNAVAQDFSQAYLYIGIGTILLAFFFVVAAYSTEFLIDHRREAKKKSSPLPAE